MIFCYVLEKQKLPLAYHNKKQILGESIQRTLSEDIT